MTKVKTFSDGSQFALEDNINKWMAQQDKTFKAVSVSFSANMVENTVYGWRYFALVTYEVG